MPDERAAVIELKYTPSSIDAFLIVANTFLRLYFAWGAQLASSNPAYVPAEPSIKEQ